MSITVTKPFLGILAGLRSIRGVARTPEAIDAVVGQFVEAGSKKSKPSDGTPRTGRFTGLHIMEFQDRLYGHNMLPGWGFTDAELAVAWRAEFPTAICNFAAKNQYVTSARADLNRGARTGLKLAQLQAQYGFDGPVNQFYGKVKEAKPEGKVKVTVKVKKAKKAKVTEPEPEAPVIDEPETVETE